MSRLFAIFVLISSAVFALGQASSGLPAPSSASTYTNAGTTGTTLNKLAKLTGAPSTAVITATTDSSGAIGVVVAGAGTSGSATIQSNGVVSLVMDGATTAGDYIQISGTTAGDGHDTGAGTCPSAGGQVIGRVLSTNVGGGTYQILLGTGGCGSGTAGGSGTNVNNNGGSTLTTSAQTGVLPYTCADTSGSGTAQVCTPSTTFTLSTDNCFIYTTTTANSSTGLTLNVNSFGAKSVAVPGASGWTTTLATSPHSIPANEPMLACYDGTNINMAATGVQGGGSGNPSALPLPTSTGFSWVNQGGATLSTLSDSTFLMQIPENSAQNWRYRVKSVPGSTPYSVAGAFTATNQGVGFGAVMPSLMISDGTKILDLECLNTGSGAVLRVEELNSATSDSTTVFSANIPNGAISAQSCYGGTLYLRIRNNGTNLYFDTSINNSSWQNVYSQTVGTWLSTITTYGWGGFDQNGTSTYINVQLLGWLETNSATQ